MSWGNLVKSMTRSFGTTATLRRTTQTYDTSDRTASPSTTDYTVTLRSATATRSHADGRVTRTKERTARIAAQGLSVEPRPGDKLIVSGDTMSVGEAEVERHQGTITAYLVTIAES